MEHPPQDIHLSARPSTFSSNKDKSALWIGTESGNMFQLVMKEGLFVVRDMALHFPQFSNEQRKILSIIETSQDLLWVGTDGDGVFKCLTRPSPFVSVLPGAVEKGNISNSIVRSIMEDPDGTLYVGTRGGGLNIIAPGKEETKVWNTQNGLKNNAVLSLKKDLDGNLWVGNDGSGIDMIENKTNKIFHFPEDFENETTLVFGHVYAICIDVYGTVWLGTSGFGVIQLQISKTGKGGYRLDSFRQITNTSQDQKSISINSNVVYNIVEEMPNILWFGTRGAGVYRFNTLTNQIEEHFSTKSVDNNRLSNDDVLSLHIGTNDLLWIGTSGGLNRLSLQRRTTKNIHYTQYEGLSNNTIHGILEDSKGMVWLSTNSGLIVFDPIKSTFKTFDIHDGLQNDEFTDGASCKSAVSEKLYFGGINGLDIINPNKVDTISFFPRLAISEFQVHNMVITPNDSSRILSQHIDKVENISLQYNQNFISFQFTTLNYWNKQHTDYGYFLENFDKEWNYINSQNVVKLTNIPPGDYKLLINYKKDGEWNPVPRSINVSVLPPLWLTTEAYAFYIFVLIAIQLAIFFSIKRRAIKKRAKAIDKLKIQQMKELNDYKFQFFTNIAHEFRTPLTLILGPVTTLIKKSSTVWEKGQLKTIYNNSLRLQKLIEELLHFRKIESGKEQLLLNKTDLIIFTQEIIESFTEHAMEHDVSIEFITEEETMPAWVDMGKLEKILINLVSNAIKYNNKGGNVEVILLEKEGKAHFIIKDTGIGISPTVQEKVFEAFYHNPDTETYENNHQKSIGIGLSLTKSLIQAHQGELLLESMLGKGSIFTVVIPIKEEAYQNALSAKSLLLPSTNLAEKVLQEFSHSINNLSHHDVVHFKHSTDQKKRYNLLVIDDNDQIIILLKSLLSEQYQIFSASNGKKGLAILDEEKIDLVICDVLMPDMDGLTLCRNIKDNIQTSHIPVILLTAKTEIEDRIEGLQVGADSYIPKPFHPEHLFIRIEKLIKNREMIKNRFSNLAEVELEQISTGMGEKDDEFFIKITYCIQKHLTNPEFTADTIAEEVGMSKASLYKKVKAITNLTPHGLIKQYRLRKAADLLRHSNMNVSEVIYETGFNSRSYFYKSFNEMFHCHPKDFGGTKVG
jgi:signal transduction histidine kinase/DNA-binding response OmpR family regulator